MDAYKRIVGFSLKEWSILIMGVIAIPLLMKLFPERWWKIYITSYALGLCFESMMAPLFSYCAAIKDRHCIDGSDINFVLPLGWVEIGATSAFLATYLFKLPTWYGYMAAALIVGNIHEFLFYKLKYWDYHYGKAMVGNFKPLSPKITVSGVPVQVISGYANVGLFTYIIFKVIQG